MKKTFVHITRGELSAASGRLSAFQEQLKHPNFLSFLGRPRVLLAAFICVVVVAGLMAAGVSHSQKSLPSAKTDSANVGVTVRAAGRGKPYLNLRDGRKLAVDYRGDRGLTNALQSGAAQPRSLASADFDGNGTPDVVAGYAFNGVGMITVQRGNPEAFAPKDESVYLRMHEGYNPDSLVPTAQTYQVPAAADFLQAGDFNNDSRKDVLVGAQGGGLFLLAGDGAGNLNAPVQIAISGVVTALAAGEFRAPDGRTDFAVGIDGPFGPQVLIYDGAAGVTGEPMHLALTSPATALEFGEMDDSPFMGLAIATGSEINVIHGWGRKQSPQLESRVEKLDTGMNVRGLASGFFIWSREGSNQLAALGDDGTIRIFGRGKLNTQPLTDQELTARARLRLQPKDTTIIDVETLSGWQAAKRKTWTKARELVTGNVVAANATRNLLRSTHISFTGTDDLMVLGGSSKVDIVRQIDTGSAPAGANLIGGDFTTTSLDSADAPATLALPQKLNGWRDLLVTQPGSSALMIVPLAPNTTITVDRTDDPAGAALTAASACTAAGNDCSLRGAVQYANTVGNSGTTILLGSNTYTLNINGNGGCVRESLATGNTIGDLEVNQTTTMMGVTAASTIINQIGTGTGPTFTGDRVLCMNVNLVSGPTFTFSAMTIAGGRDVASGVGGGGFIGGAKGTALNLTDMIFANNQTSPGVPQGPSGGGGVAVTGGDMTVKNCTFGGANLPGASRTDTTLGNAAITLSGGGLSYSAGDPKGTNGATGTLTITGTTFTHNTSSSVSNGGGGFDVYDFNTSVGTADISSSVFTGNQATGTASGGGIFNHGVSNLFIATTSFTSNSAGNRGGGMYVAGGLNTLLNGTTPSIIFSNNTAGTAGSSISAAGGVTVSGTNTTIGGDLEITTNGIWTNSTGSVISPTNFIMTGTANFIGNNSTTNIGGDFNFGSGTFNAGTSTFNFNGAIAQSITNSSSITFFNLTDSNITQPLTLNNNFAVNGTLNVNGANSILSPAAGAIISGTGTLTGTGTARASRIAATADFLSQYTITNKTLTSLTIDYNGAGNQTVNNTPAYSNVVISGSGIKTLQGNTVITRNLTTVAGATFASGNFNFALGGNWTNGGAFTAGTGTVTFQGSTGTQLLSGNTTFFNLALNNAGATTSFGNTTTTVGNDLTATAGTMDGGTSTMIFSGVTDNAGAILGAGSKNFFNLQINSPAVIAHNSGGNITIENNYSNAGTFNQSAALTTTFDLDNSADGAHALSGAGATTFGVFTINAANTVDAGSHNFNVIGAVFTVDGTFTGNTSTVSFIGAGAQGMAGNGAKNFSGLLINNPVSVNVINGAGAVDASVSGSLTLTTDLTVASGAILQQSGTSTGTKDVIGTVRRTDLGVTERSFGNVNNTITVGTGTPPQMGLQPGQGSARHVSGYGQGRTARHYADAYWRRRIFRDGEIALHRSRRANRSRHHRIQIDSVEELASVWNATGRHG
jgi:hypothetical protein